MFRGFFYLHFFKQGKIIELFLKVKKKKNKLVSKGFFIFFSLDCFCYN